MEYFEERKDICNTCEYNGGWFCKKCGCVLPVKIKIRESKCPIDKWKKIIINTQKQ